MSPTTESKATLGSKAISLPNEILGQIVEYLSPLDALSAGTTCKSLQDVVNDRARVISIPVIHRERARLEKDMEMALTGLPLDECVRSWTLHHSHLEESDIVKTSAHIAMAFMMANKIDLHYTDDLKDRDFYRFLVEYLLHVNHVAHYKTQKSTAHESENLTDTSLKMKLPLQQSSQMCKCLMCRIRHSSESGKTCCWIDSAVRKFAKTGWENKLYPSAFLEHVSSPTTKKLLTDKQWLQMVDSVLTQPLEDTTNAEKSAANKALLSQVIQGMGAGPELRDLRHIQSKFGELAGLPRIPQAEWRMYVPRMKAYGMRQCLRAKYWREPDAKTLGARAAKEFCLRVEGPLAGQEKMLDPKNRLLLAVVLEELHVVFGKVPAVQSKTIKMRPRTAME